MTPEPIHYNYALLGKVVTGIVLLLVLVIFAITFKWLPRGSKWLSAWLREKRGDVLSVVVLTCWEVLTEVWIPMGLVALFSLAIGLAIK